MAMKPCPDCGTPVSNRAAICPKCGRRRPYRNPVIGKAMGIGCLVFVVVAGACLAFAVMMQPK
jgi:hypothetical protein